jgi:aminocarboxymuconate-semialdehyde decarboxylase
VEKYLMLKIDIHTHIIPEHIPNFKSRFGYGGFIKLEPINCSCARLLHDDGKFFRNINANCWDESVRLDECKKTGVSVQVLSTIPAFFNYWAQPQDALVVSQYLNDHIAQVASGHPYNFIGLGTVPLQDPDLAIKELHRCMTTLDLAGVEIGSHVNDWNLDEPSLFPFFQEAEKLGAAIFVHPWDMVGKSEMPKYWLPWLLGMPTETARAICYMIFSGIFEKLPKLRVAFAHGGGSFPYILGRIRHGFKVRPDLCAIDNPHDPIRYLGKFYVDSLVHDKQALEYLIKLFGEDYIALGSDYPFPLGESQPGELIDSMTYLSSSVKENLFSGTALKWLNLDKEKFINEEGKAELVTGRM